jgi:hypothetical protein
MKTILRVGAFLTALSCFGAAMAQETNEVAAHISAAKLHETRGELARAEQELRTALEKAPVAERDLVANALATLLVRQGRNNEAAALTGKLPPGQGTVEDPIQRLIAVLDSGAVSNDAVKDAAAQLDSLGALVVPHLLAALPRLGPFGTNNVLDRLVNYDDPRITAALANLIDTADAAVAAAIGARVQDMPRSVALPLAQRIAQAKLEPKMQANALAVLLAHDAAAASTRQLAQRLAADPSGESQASLIETLDKAQEPWVVDVFAALMQHASAEVRAHATFRWIRAKKDVTEQQALTAIEALPPASIVWVSDSVGSLHPDWVKVGLLLLRKIRQGAPSNVNPQVLLQRWEWWRMPDESGPELLAARFVDRPQHEPLGPKAILAAVGELVARGWVLPPSLDGRLAEVATAYTNAPSYDNGWKLLANALPADAEDRAIAVWEKASDRRSFVQFAIAAERPWHRLVAKHLLQATRSNQVEPWLLQRDWTGAPPEAVAALADLATRWPESPSGGQLQWHPALVGVFQRNGILPSSVILPLVAAGNRDAWQALLVRDPQAALDQARGAARLHAHQVGDLAALLSRHGRSTDVPLALRAFEMAESLNWGEFSQFIAFFADQAAGHLDVIRLACAPVPIGPGQSARLHVACKAAKGARVQDLGELLALAPALQGDCCDALMESLAPQVRSEHAASLIAAIEAVLTGPIGPMQDNVLERPIDASRLLARLCILAGNTDNAAALPVLKRVLALADAGAFVLTTASDAALRVAGASRPKLVLEMLASPKVAVVRAALGTADERIDAEFRDRMRDAVLRVGETLENVEPFFAKLGTDDRVALGVAVLESERFAKFTPALCGAALGAVGLRKDVRYLPQLVKGASHPDRSVRIQAANALGNTFSREAGSHLIEMLRDDSPSVRQAAQAALDQIANYLDARAKWEERFK